MTDEERKRSEYEQILTFWKWLKACEIPKTDADWSNVVTTAAAVSDNSKPLLTELLIVGIDYMQDIWRRNNECG